VCRPSLHVVPPSRSHPAPDITALTWLTRNTRRTHAAICPPPAAPRDPPPRTTGPRRLPSSCVPRPRVVRSLYDESLQRESERGKEAGGTRPFSVSASPPLALQVEPRRSPPLCCVACAFKFYKCRSMSNGITDFRKSQLLVRKEEGRRKFCTSTYPCASRNVEQNQSVQL
jgi:hypothetical protein